MHKFVKLLSLETYVKFKGNMGRQAGTLLILCAVLTEFIVKCIVIIP